MTELIPIGTKVETTVESGNERVCGTILSYSDDHGSYAVAYESASEHQYFVWKDREDITLKEPKVPIYNDPNHPNYGPCRRVHLILMYLFGDDLALLEQCYREEHGEDWTEGLNRWSDEGLPEGGNADFVIRTLGDIQRTTRFDQRQKR